MADTMLSTTNLTKRYGSLQAVSDVTVNIEKGSIVGLIGKNGAGKTTLIRILTGLVKPSSGTFEILPGQVRTNCDIAAIVERPSIYTNLTAMDNLKAQSILLNIPFDKDYLCKTLELVGLDPASPKLAKRFSLGMKQRLAIAMTLVGKPKLLLLDEPTNGLDPEGMRDMREIFVRLNQEFGATILISSHILAELSKVATDYLFMDKGKIIKQATAQELEKIGQKRVRVFVEDVEKAKSVLEQFGEVTAYENAVELSAETPPTQILLTLAKNGVTATNIVNVGDDLEAFFMGLIDKKEENNA